MSAAELRRAAETLRARATAGDIDNTFEWTQSGVEGYACDGSWVTPYDSHLANYIATVHPGVGLNLADWLEQCAVRLDRGHHAGSRYSHQIARLINGSAS